MIERRAFLKGLAATGTGLLGPVRAGFAAEPPPETTRLRLARSRWGICVAPKYVAEELLRAEGFTDVTYTAIETMPGIRQALVTGETDFEMTFVTLLTSWIAAGDPIVILAGAHAGCFELFGGPTVRAIRDLKGKRVGIVAVGGPDHAFIASMLAHVGLDPRKDIEWVTVPHAEMTKQFADGRVDAILGLPPIPQDLRARGIGRVIVNSAADRPWSQYFCCLVAGNREFVRRYPVATKRALRAFVKAANVCATEPERAARRLIDHGMGARYELALQTMKDVPYGRWRDYDAEDTVRYYALRMHEAGMIKTSPQKILADGTDWRFLKELKKELKG